MPLMKAITILCGCAVQPCTTLKRPLGAALYKLQSPRLGCRAFFFFPPLTAKCDLNLRDVKGLE